jgi:elongation factor 1-gamma
MSIKLHAPVGHGRTNKILVAAALAHVPVELVNTQLNDKNI